MNTDGQNPGLDLHVPDETYEAPEQEEKPAVEASKGDEGLYRLINIHLVDSLSRGRVQTMGIDGGMALTGRNGRGKTSLLSLALLFVGVEPRDVVSQGKDSFIDYYLPNQTSYLVYEYERPDGSRRLVVVLSNSTADKIRFRFVNSHFRREMFVTEDGQFVLNKEFRQRLIHLKIQHAEKLVDTYTDYRAIIQGWQPPHVDQTHRRYLLGMSDVYGFTTYNRPLRHLEKLTKGMFSRKANFDDLQQVVADWVFEGKPSAGIHTERKRVETWPRDYSAYQSIMRITPLVDVARIQRSELEAAEDGMREIKEKFIHLKDHLHSSKTQRQSEQSRKQTYLEEEQVTHDETSKTLTRSIETARAEIEACDRGLQNIEASRLDYEAKDVESKRAQAAQRELFTDELRSIDAQLELALGAATGIKAKYDKQINEEERRHNEFCNVAMEKINRLRDAEHESRDKLEAAYKEASEVLTDSSADELDHLSKEKDRNHGELARAQERVENPPFDTAVKNAIDAKNGELRNANRSISTAHTNVIDRQRDVDGLQSSSSRHDETIEALRLSISQQHTLIEEIKRAHTPDQDSLLAFLRTNRSDWAKDIAKVINPELLHRHDLHPQLTAMGESLYGVFLDLDFVDPVDEADESKLNERLEEASRVLEAFESQLERAIGQQLEIRQSLKTANEELSLARSALTKSKSAAQTLEREVDQLNEKLEKKLNDARQLAREHLAECQRLLNHAVQAHADFTQRLADKHQALVLQRDRGIAEASELLKAEVREIQASVEGHKETCDASTKFLREQLNKELAGEGADLNVISALEARQTALNQTLADINSWSELLAQWHIWKQQVLPEIPVLQAKRSQRQLDLENDSVRLAEAESAWNRKREQVLAAITECRSAIAGFDSQLLIVGNCLDDRLIAFEPTSRHEAYDAAWEAHILRATMTTLLQQIKEAQNQLRNLTGRMRTAFHEVAQAAPSTYFHDRLFNLQTETGDEVDARMMLRVVEDWFATEHDKSRRLLVADAKTIFGEIQGLHRELQTFNKKLTSFNTALQDHLEHSSAVFDNLSELKISIYSGVEELDYWSVITKITNDREEWTQEDALPGADAVAHLSALLALWDSKRGISAQFKSLVSIRGSVREQGNFRQFRNRTELENISSNGLSYLVLIILFLGFIGKVRGNAPVQLTWCVDELKAIDAENIVSLCNYLGQNRITLCTAFPDPDAETLMLFEHKYKLDAERRLVHCELAIEGEPIEDGELELAWEDGE